MEGYKKQRTQRQTRPLFVVGYEGLTEWNYVESLIHHHNMTCRRACSSENRPDALLSSVLRIASIESNRNRNRSVIPLIVLDIEVMSDQNITDMRSFVESARAKGVHVIVNRPKIEHWFLQHFQSAPENMSPMTIDRRLAHHLKTHNLPEYTKPGGPSFYAAINQLYDKATTHCAASNHSSYELPCMCHLVQLIHEHQM